jgi:serine O-acetyltransferase
LLREEEHCTLKRELRCDLGKLLCSARRRTWGRVRVECKMSDVSATEADRGRERVAAFSWSAGARLVRAIRGYQRWKRAGIWGMPLRVICAMRYRFWSVMSGADIPLTCSLGGGLLLTHPNGIVIHPEARVGVNCLIFQQVTLGVGGRVPGAPRIGGHVDIGAGAKILGGVVIGDHAKIGANAVVLCDVPAGATAVGVPARVILGEEVAARENGGQAQRLNRI